MPLITQTYDRQSKRAMALQPVTIHLPNTLYQRVVRRARQMKRSIEDELVNVVKTALPSLYHLPSDIVARMAQLTFLTDAELQQAAKLAVTAQEAERMETLLFKLLREGLTAAEQEEANQLLHRSDKILLVRAQAILLLTERGLDISTLKAVR
jgi:hypothetical protein